MIPPRKNQAAPDIGRLLFQAYWEARMARECRGVIPFASVTPRFGIQRLLWNKVEAYGKEAMGLALGAIREAAMCIDGNDRVDVAAEWLARRIGL